ncbi:NAD-dependent epimerase/dehydratase family protein [Elizabethkingia bruuniana]|uniref:NAD-dependent epimerase/dehydratase family protein n=1 Tax=Elizabethkingia bruuniana TaxID=1756149 RepID=A0A7T7V1P0_9FLAO|nr:NAD-dependent epimerase/dehydratase family protein [Elizabethkingia bruuniana]KGO11943.1 dihydroflavonol 4-reductase [Elizabethkingia miricola]AQX86166.1 dihydroflavonol 4-reductase [Elizabethkingia bruuniana]KUY24678.1 dihydroflavonol 4-reductase [Elizabethkingia bruuniana]OPB61731.1 dihydroflavonol 4-reductase [Elizabethkingia bruuniana]QDZ64512.1 NAD-dependent epimerase/dehydratase family protein [Elizabethkingia bruuniana]
MKNIFITGISGLLGTNLVNLLLEQNYRVTGLIRNPDSFTGTRNENLTLLKGNLFDDYSTIFSDTDIVIHIAAETKQNILQYEDYYKINYEATHHLYETAVKSDVKKFIFVSTANTSGFADSDGLGNEDKPMKFPFTKSFYALSKKAAEDYLLQQNNATETVIICPTFMLGAFDTKPSSGRIILMGLHKKLILYPPGGKNFVYVKDVAQTIINAIPHAKNGKKYIACNENISYKDFFQKLNTINNQNPLMIKVPGFVLRIAGLFGDLLRKLNIKTDLCTPNMESLCIENYYTNHKSATELNVQYHSIETAIKEASDYFNTDFRKANQKH